MTTHQSLPTMRTVSDATTDPAPVHQPRRGRLVIIVVVAVMAAAVGWVTSHQPHDSAASDGLPTATQSDGQVIARSSAPPTSLTTQAAASTLTLAAATVSWQGVAGLSLPVSQVAGPRCQNDGRATCFAHTDDGAALAAVHLLVRTFPFVGSSVFLPTIREQVIGPDAAVLERLTTDAYRQIAAAAGISGGAPIPSEGGWVAGYQPDPAEIDVPQGNSQTGGQSRMVRVLIRQASGERVAGFTEYAVHLVWRGTDWALVAPAWGDWRSSARAMSAADPALYRSYDTIGRP